MYTGHHLLCTLLGANAAKIQHDRTHLDSRLNGDGGDLLDHVSRGVQVNETLVDPASTAAGRPIPLAKLGDDLHGLTDPWMAAASS